MTDVLVYWRDYKQNWLRQQPGERAWYWHSSSKVLGDLQPGDRLWLVTSGENVQAEARQAGFLVAIWKVKEVLANPGDDPAYPRDDYRYRVVADSAESVRLDEAALVDPILRPPGRDRAVSIGRFVQGPRKLSDEKVRLLRAAAGPELALKWLTGNKS
jgi:hypothetical protein